MKLRLLSVMAAVLAVLLVSGHAWAAGGKRVALVIGNGTYPNIGDLANPPKDARLMANTLRQVGFDVIESIDVDQKAMKRAVKSFGEKLTDAGKDAVGLFYYAGHGVQVGGTNYMIPVRVDIKTEADVDIEALSANAVQAQMAFAGNRLNIIVMDACRNNPFKRSFRSATRGLAEMNATMGTLIAYATGPGDVAADGTGDNSPYTESLSRAILTPGLTVERVFKQVRNDVVAATDKQQVPWESSSLTGGDFYFQGGPVTAVQPTTEPQPQPAMTPDMMAWNSIQNSTNPKEIEAFILAFRSSPFAGMARARLEALKEKPQQTAMVAPPRPTPPPSQAKPAVGVYPGDTFRDCAECPEMVVIPAGSFRMGGWGSSEEPIHDVTIPRSFAVGKYEVTFAEWDACVAAAGCSRDPKDNFWGRDNRPVINVGWDYAKAYTYWLNRKTGEQYRLLSESEWEYMARAGSTSTYPFGDSESSLCDQGNGAGKYYSWGNKSCSDGYAEKTAPVGSFKPNAFGVYDTVGNVSEWVEDCWHDGYNGAPSDGNAWTSGGDCSMRVHRGGSWHDGPSGLRSVARDGKFPFSDVITGFRVARDL